MKHKTFTPDPATSLPQHVRGEFCPGPRAIIVVAVCGAGILAVQRLPVDLAIINLATVLLLGVAVACLLLWYSVCSGYSFLMRWCGTVLFVGIVASLLVAFRIERVTGGLIPKIVPRWSSSPDKLLAQPQSVKADAVDLWTETDQDFPQFLGPYRRSETKSVRLDPDWTAHPPVELWRQPIGAGWSGFAAVNGYAVTMEQRADSELVTCYEIATGELKWSHAVSTRHESWLGYVGPRSTPTIHEGRVYAMGATGILRCLDGADGREIWVRRLFADYGFSQDGAERGVAWGRSNSPLVVRNQLVVPVGGPLDGPWVSLAALDLSTGATLWESGGVQASYASPIVATLQELEHVVSVNESNVTGHDIETGEILWEHPWPGSSRAMSNVSQPMPVDGQRVLLTKGYGRGAELIEVRRRGDHDVWSTETLWSNSRVLKTKFSNVAIRDGFAYGLDDGVLCCVDIETGARQWKKGRYKYGQILLVHDLLLVMSEDGELALVRASPEGHSELGRVQALSDQAWNTMCLYGPNLIVRNAEEAACYVLPLDEVIQSE